MGIGRFFYFNYSGKLDLYYILKTIHPVIKNNSSGLSVECTEMNWNHKGANGLRVPILLNNMVWYLVFIVNIHNNECLIYKFIGKFQNGTLSIFNKNVSFLV